MAGLFNLPSRTTKAGDKSLLQKKPKKSKVPIKGGGIFDKIQKIISLVNKYMGGYKDKYIIINTEKELTEYIDKAIENNIISIDTETTGLNPINDTIAGVCIYTPSLKAAYIPLNHVSYITGQKVDNQLSEEFVSEQLQRVVDSKIKTIFHNAKFDIRFIKNQLNVTITPFWDTFIAAKILNENEETHSLKPLHKKYCMNGEGDAFKFDELFKDIKFTQIPIETGYLYAARDAEITYELYKFQLDFLSDNSENAQDEYKGISNIYHNIEMPLLPVVIEMEDTGIEFDLEYAHELSEKYSKLLEEAKTEFYTTCDGFGEDLDRYRERMGVNNKLEYPINISSPSQIAIMLYDVLKLPTDEKTKRGTGEEVLKNLKHPITEAILKYREIEKLLSTYIDKLPLEVNKKTGRIHAGFNQVGTDTGRFSSQNPNMQNIPSHNKEVRKMFRASENYVLLSSDYSAQEPRITSCLSKDKRMIQAYKDDKDLYVEIASIAFNLPYNECKEFRDDGSKNPEGKQRRSKAKAIVLGVCYGKGVKAIAEDLGISKEEGQKIFDKIMKEFPGLPSFMKESEDMARDKGYVETFYGRKRRLPNMSLPPYEFTYIGTKKNFDPLDTLDDDTSEYEIDERVINKYTKQMDKAYGKNAKQQIKDKALSEGIVIKDNGGFIADATRQCVNSRIQGTAADLTKIAMILIGNNERLKELGFKLLLPVHDELIGECPKENVKEVSELFSKLMIEAAKDFEVPFKCDVEVTECWSGEIIE